MGMNRVSAFLISIALIGCTSRRLSDEIIGNVTTIVVDSPSSNKEISVDSLFENLTFVRLETNDNCLVASIDQLVVGKRYLYVFDQMQHALLIFDLKGRFIKKIVDGRDPQSPVDFHDFVIGENDEITVLSYMEILKYTASGEFLERKRFKIDDSYADYVHPIKLSSVGSNYLIWAGSVGRKDLDVRPEYGLFRLAEDFTVLSKCFLVERELLEIPRFQKFDSRVYIIPYKLKDTIFVADRNNIAASFHIDYGENSVSRNSLVRDLRLDESRVVYELSKNTNMCGGTLTFIPIDNFIYFLYDCGVTRYQAVYSVIGNKVKSGIFYSSRQKPVIYPLTGDGDKLVGFAYPSDLLSRKHELAAITSPVANELLVGLEADENPLIWFGSLRTF